MKDPQHMQLFQPLNNLNKQTPDHLLGHELIFLLVILNPRGQILIICQLHYYTISLKKLPQRFSRLIDKCLLVADYVHVANRCQDSDLVQSVLFLFLR